MSPGPAIDRTPSPPTCHADVCLTCSDQAVPARVRRLLDDGMALVDTGSTIEEASVALVGANVGDLLLVHAGEAISRLEEDPS